MKLVFFLMTTLKQEASSKCNFNLLFYVYDCDCGSTDVYAFYLLSAGVCCSGVHASTFGRATLTNVAAGYSDDTYVDRHVQIDRLAPRVPSLAL